MKSWLRRRRSAARTIAVNQETVRNHLHAVANRIERELGEEPIRLFEGSDQDWEEQPFPDGPMKALRIQGGLGWPATWVCYLTFPRSDVPRVVLSANMIRLGTAGETILS